MIKAIAFITILVYDRQEKIITIIQFENILLTNL